MVFDKGEGHELGVMLVGSSGSGEGTVGRRGGGGVGTFNIGGQGGGEGEFVGVRRGGT